MQAVALRTLKMFPWHVLQSQFQALLFSLKATLAHSPLPAQSRRCGKKFFRCTSGSVSAERQLFPIPASKSVVYSRSSTMGTRSLSEPDPDWYRQNELSSTVPSV